MLGSEVDRNVVKLELASFHKTTEAQRRHPEMTFISVGDPEADIYDLFELAFWENSAPELLARASHDRLLGEGQGYLWERVEQKEMSGIQEVKIPRRGNRPGRVVQLEVRFAEVGLKPPNRKSGLRELTIWAVLAREADPPSDVEPLQWMLLTTIEVATFEQAIEKLAWL